MNFAKLAPLVSCVLSFLAGVAYAQGFVRAPARGDGLVPLDLAAAGVTIEPIGIAYEVPHGRGFDLVVCRPSPSPLEGP